MARSEKSRGRPKGSGIDDTPALKKIARLLANDPDLKPTTAIRKLGYTNPSTIRRLRDKLKSHLKTKVSKDGLSSSKKQNPPTERSTEQRNGTSAPTEQPVQPDDRTGQEEAGEREGLDPFPWMEFATRFSMLAAQGQLAIAQTLLRHPSMHYAIAQQARVMNTMFDLYFATPPYRKRPDETSE